MSKQTEDLCFLPKRATRRKTIKYRDGTYVMQYVELWKDPSRGIESYYGRWEKDGHQVTWGPGTKLLIIRMVKHYLPLCNGPEDLKQIIRGKQ